MPISPLLYAIHSITSSSSYSESTLSGFISFNLKYVKIIVCKISCFLAKKGLVEGNKCSTEGNEDPEQKIMSLSKAST